MLRLTLDKTLYQTSQNKELHFLGYRLKTIYKIQQFQDSNQESTILERKDYN